jgi:hypothetical protein
MAVLLIADTATLIGVLYFNFSELLETNELLFSFIIAFVICMSLSVVYSYFAFAEVVKERDKLKALPIDSGHESILLKALDGFQIEPVPCEDEQFISLLSSAAEITLVGNSFVWNAQINRTNSTIEIKCPIEDGVEWPCVLQHLKDSPLPGTFAQWRSAMEQDLRARIALFDAVCKQIKEHIDLPISSDVNTAGMFLTSYYPTTLYKQIFCNVIGKPKGKRNVEDFRSQYVGIIVLGNVEIIHCNNNRQQADSAIQFWVESQTKLIDLPESERAKKAYEAGQSKTREFNKEKQKVMTTARLPDGSKCERCP